MELAYRLAVEDSPLVKQIRENVIVSITPVADPDGRDRYVDWYYKYKHRRDRRADRPAPACPTGASTSSTTTTATSTTRRSTMRALLDWYLHWHPPIMHDLHEAQTLLYTFSGQAPQNPNLDPILYAELPLFSNFEMAKMTKYGMPGVWTHAFVDMWSPGYLGFMSSNHNGMLRMYEIQGTGGANTTKLRLGNPNAPAAGGGRGGAPAAPDAAAIPPDAATRRCASGTAHGRRPASSTGRCATTPTTWRPACCRRSSCTATFPNVILENFYQKTRNSIDAGKTEAPYGFVIPAGQRDMTRVALLVNMLRMQGIEVGSATAKSSSRRAPSRPAPTWSSAISRTAGSPRSCSRSRTIPIPSPAPTTTAAWTMGMMSQTEVKEIDDKAILDVAGHAGRAATSKLAGAVTGAGSLSAVAHNGSNNLITLRYRLKDREGGGGGEGVQAGRRRPSRPARSSSAASAARVQGRRSKRSA